MKKKAFSSRLTVHRKRFFAVSCQLLAVSLVLLSAVSYSFAETYSFESKGNDQVALLAEILPAYTVAGGGTSCTTADYNPSADTDANTWTHSAGSTHYEAVDDWGAGDSDWLTGYDNPGIASDTLRFTLPGDCNVSTVQVWVRHSTGSPTITLRIDVSNDNSNWTSTQDFSVASGTPTNESKDYTSLNWTNPSYVYVRFKLASSTWNAVSMLSMKVTVNP